MDVAQLIANGLRSGDHLWSLPLAAALGPDGRRSIVRWVERCLHRAVDLADIRMRSGSIHARIEGASVAAAAVDLGSVVAKIEQEGLRGDPVVDAIAMLHIANWQAVHRSDNQFAVSQESVFRRLRAVLSDSEWERVAELAAEEFRVALGQFQDAERVTAPDGDERS
jgi:hypothetical protein